MDREDSICIKAGSKTAQLEEQMEKDGIGNTVICMKKEDKYVDIMLMCSPGFGTVAKPLVIPENVEIEFEAKKVRLTSH